MRKIAVLISGCGHKDGAEITEVVSLLIALSLRKVSVTCFSLDLDVPVFDHNAQIEKPNEFRNLLSESARISRGEIRNIKDLRVDQFDGLAIPGGLGTAKHFCSWAHNGVSFTVHPEVERVVKDFFTQEKPIAAVCIAPVILAKVLGAHNPTITLGPKSSDSEKLRSLGAIVIECPADDFVTDRDHKILTAPAFMHNTNYGQVFTGINKMCQELVEMA